MKKLLLVLFIFSGIQLAAQVKEDLFIPIDIETNKNKIPGSC